MTKHPRVGLIVNYVPTEKQKQEWKADIAPAIITRVFNQAMVNLHVFLDAPKTSWETSVEFDGKNAERSWHWPIDQKD